MDYEKLNNHIDQCEENIRQKDNIKAQFLLCEILEEYEGIIEGIDKGVGLFVPKGEDPFDYLKDIPVLKERLVKYRDSLNKE